MSTDDTLQITKDIMTRYLVVMAIALVAMTACSEPSPDTSAEASASSGEPDLLALMKQLDQDMAHVDAALFRNDFAGVATAANTIANHPRVSANERERIQAALGDDFPNFVKADQATHKSAAALAAAATADDLDGVLRELDTLTRSCVGCHEDFRTRLRPGS